MLPCWNPLLPSSSGHFTSPTSQGYSTENTPRSNVLLSPTVNLTREYTLAVQTNSYVEIRQAFDQTHFFDHTVDIEHVESFEDLQLLDQVLRPSRECIQESLALIKPNSLITLVSTYFEHSEHTSRLCLILYHSLQRARLLYNPIHKLLDDLPLELESDSFLLSDHQCELAFNVFLQFDRLENPFLSPDSQNFNEMRQCFSQLKFQLDRYLKKSQSKIHYIRNCSTGSALCLIAASIGVVIAAVTIATHALVALVATPVCPMILTSNMTKREMMHIAQVDAAAKGAYVLHKDLDTIDRLVAHLHASVENDKILVHLGLDRGVDRYPIQEILKQLQKNRSSFIQQLMDLEDHLFLCFAAINRARSLLLQELLMHQESI